MMACGGVWSSLEEGRPGGAQKEIPIRCDADLMVGVSTGDIKGVENTGVLGVPPPTWAVHPDWDFLGATGSNAAPELADLDNDGDLDMLVGFSDGRYKAYQNNGSQEIPYWVENSSWAPTLDIGGFAVPTMGDLDGDGDLDIIAGNSNGQVEAYENNGDAEAPGSWTVASSWTSGIADVGTYAAPELLDLDGDGILDILIGNQTGTCTAYRNSASSAPSWSRSSGWDIPDQSAYAVPASADLDDDGDYDILLGDRYGSTCKAWENTGSTSSPTWTRNATWDVSITGGYTAPTLGDLDREVGPILFADGFETGDTSAWSDTVIEGEKRATARGLRGKSRLPGHLNRRRDGNGGNTGQVRRGDSNGLSLSTQVQPATISSKAITNDVYAYSFNAADSLTQVSWQHGVIEDYTYDGNGLRIKKIAGSDEIVYIRDPGGNVIAEYDEANTLLAEYIYANGHQVAKVEPDGGAGEDISFFHSDHLGTALVITDELGALTWRGEYFPFGEEYSSEGTPNRYRFVERELDTSTGLSYMRARYYNSHLGRFLAVDPVRGRISSPQSWNRYSYVGNRPLISVDPYGEETKVLVGARTDRNPAGHIGIEINGTVYSAGSFYVNQGPGGDWGVPVDLYLERQHGIRETEILTLDITPSQEAALEDSLQNRDPGTYVGLIEGSCVDVCEKALEGVGILPNDPGPLVVDRAGNLLQAGAPASITPRGLKKQLERSGQVDEAITVGTPPTVSWWTSVINGVRDVLSRPRE